MSHQRTFIRNALVTLLKGSSPTYATNVSDRVYPNHTNNIASANLPAIIIYHDNETATPRDLRSASYIRTLIFKIEIIVEGTNGYDKDLDDICIQVENLINTDRSITGTATSTKYISTDLIFDGSGKQTIGKATLTYEVNYIL
jgi:hypothetical protein